MCRYAFHTYKSHFACFSCRKAFKKTALEDYVKHKGLERSYSLIVSVFGSRARRARVEKELGITYQQIRQRYLDDVSACPQCSKKMAAMGMDFRAPARRDEEAWRITAHLYEHGFSFLGCGCSAGHAPPRSMSELPAWLKKYKTMSSGERLLEAIEMKAGR